MKLNIFQSEWWVNKPRKEWWDSLTFEEKRMQDRHNLTRDELWDSLTPEERNKNFISFLKFMVIGLSISSLILFLIWVTGNW